MAFRTPLGSQGGIDSSNSMVNSMAVGLGHTVNLASSISGNSNMVGGMSMTNDQLTNSLANNMGTGALGQFGLSRKQTSELSPGSRKTMAGLPTPPTQQPPMPMGSMGSMGSQGQQSQQPSFNFGKIKKSGGLFDEVEDQETSMYFPNSSNSIFRPDKEMLQSQSPSQLSGFGNFYPQGFSLPQQQRGAVSGSQFQRNNAPTPTSINPNFNSIGMQQNSPNRGMISAIGQQRMMNNTPSSQSNLQKRPIGSGLITNTAPISSLSSSFGYAQTRGLYSTGADSSQPNFDLSEFPLLGNRVTTSSSSLPGQCNYGMVSKPVQDQTPEFQIQQEDFPALPGAQSTLSIFVSDPPTSSSGGENVRMQPLNLISGSAYDQGLSKDGKYSSESKSGAAGQRKMIQTHADGRLMNIPPGMVTDQFGIIGLLAFIKDTEREPSLMTLAPGLDLTTLGLNITSPDNLYSTFQSPWVDLPCRPQDIDFHVPAEYLTNIYVREKLAPIKLNRYGEDILFFFFYMYGGDVLQMAAAAELYQRDWRYHKDEQVWITRAPGVEPIAKSTTYERGTYYVFDAQTWWKVKREFLLEYDRLEDMPTLPS